MENRVQMYSQQSTKYLQSFKQRLIEETDWNEKEIKLLTDIINNKLNNIVIKCPTNWNCGANCTNKCIR